MVLPIGDAPNPRSPAVVTWLLIAANVAVYVLVSMPLSVRPVDPGDPALQEYLRVMVDATRGQVSPARLLHEATAYDLFVFTHGFRPAAPSLVDLFASMFLHAGFLHLAGNMLFLWIYGDNVEHRLGAGRYLVAYLATGVAATAFHAVGDLRSAIPMVGASGAISGVLGFYFVWFPRNHVRLLWLLPPFVMQVFEVPARLVLGAYLVLENVLPYLVSEAGGPGVAHGAHIGGFVAGLGAAWVLDRRALGERPPEYAERREPRDAARTRLAEAVDAGRWAEAARHWFALPPPARRGALSPDDALALAGWLAEHGHDEGALVVVRNLLRDRPRGPGAAEANLLAGELLLARGEWAMAYQYLRAALDADPPPDVAAQARRALARLDTVQAPRLGHLHARRDDRI
jgi:membrane associated rhomboid family serine protease